jgi:hypothetical protein
MKLIEEIFTDINRGKLPFAPPGSFKRMKVLAEEQAAIAYREMTDSTRSTRHWVSLAQESARPRKRVKPDPELHPLAELDYEKQTLSVG